MMRADSDRRACSTLVAVLTVRSKWLSALGKSSRESKTASSSIGFPAGPGGDVNSSLGNGALRIRRIEKALFEHPARYVGVSLSYG